MPEFRGAYDTALEAATKVCGSCALHMAWSNILVFAQLERVLHLKLNGGLQDMEGLCRLVSTHRFLLCRNSI